MSIHLPSTKFHIPPPRPGDVPRQGLLERLAAGVREQRKLTLVCAPAGYGKTTLVVAWINTFRQEGGQAAWLSLDEADNDPHRFFGLWISALRLAAHDSTGEVVFPHLDPAHLPPVDGLIDEMINALAALVAPMALILDDFHAISHPQIHAAVEYWLDHLPARVHLMILTRHDPPLPLARMRAHRQVTEFRARDLRFSLAEARQFFNQAMRLEISAEVVAALEERTEGWPVGLQLAGLAFQNLDDPRGFIDTFRGSHHYVFDYLAEEVLRQQSAELRAFLTQTSILDRFNAPLCAALTGQPNAQEIIVHLQQANLFVIPLDDERHWYRYHHLFADYLRILLTKAEKTALYQKASAWHRQQRLMEDAVRYALHSGDGEFAAEVIGQALHDDSTWSEGNLALYASWVNDLPPAALAARPALCLNASRIFYLKNRFDLAESYIAQAETGLHALPDSPENGQLRALAALYRGSIAAVRGDAALALEQISFARARLAPENHLAHARALYSLGLACEASAHSAPAEQHYLQSSDEAQRAAVLFLAVHARCAAAQVQIQHGRLTLAEQTCREAVQLVQGARIPPVGLAEILLGGIALEHNYLPAAEEHLQAGIALARAGGLWDDALLGLASLARVQALSGSPALAAATYREAAAMLTHHPASRLAPRAAGYLARMQLLAGELQSARQWAQAYQAQRSAPLQADDELTLARIWLADGRASDLPALLAPLIEQAECAGRLRICIEAMLLQALACRAQGDLPAAVDWLGKSLRLAAPEGFRRIFLDEGQPLLDLLPQARRHAPALVDALWAAAAPEAQAPASPLERLPDPLSEQELRVLRLVVAGKSNREIAAELFISVGTAKWHVHHVFQKLGVGNRPQAIARTRELNLL